MGFRGWHCIDFGGIEFGSVRCIRIPRIQPCPLESTLHTVLFVETVFNSRMENTNNTVLAQCLTCVGGVGLP